MKNNAFELISLLTKPEKVVVSYPVNYKGTEGRAAAFVSSMTDYFTVGGSPLSPVRTDKKRALTKDEELKEYAFDTATYENGKYKLLLSKSANRKSTPAVSFRCCPTKKILRRKTY